MFPYLKASELKKLKPNHSYIDDKNRTPNNQNSRYDHYKKTDIDPASFLKKFDINFNKFASYVRNVNSEQKGFNVLQIIVSGGQLTQQFYGYN